MASVALHVHNKARTHRAAKQCRSSQWVEGDNEALHYRGRELKRGKMWFQLGEPRTEGFVKYFYTGWQRAVLPATADVERAPELARVVKKYNELALGMEGMAAWATGTRCRATRQWNWGRSSAIRAHARCAI